LWITQKFTAQEHDSETQLDFFQARYLSAAQGRFLSPDPMNAGADPLNPQSWNGYRYVLNNPLNSIDPFGLWNWNLGNCYFNTVASYVDGEFQGYDTQFVGCFDLSGGYDRLGPFGSQQPPPPPQPSQRPEPQKPQTDCSHPPAMPPGPDLVDITTNMQDTARKGFLWWVNQVRPFGSWDFKNNYKNPSYAAFGNVNFGATCNALGLSLEACQRGAGAAALMSSICKRLINPC
jgi:RHS repeat-associated protein